MMATLVAVALLLGACGDDERPEHRYEGPVPPCNVAISDEPASPDDLEAAREVNAPDFWKPGPYGVWNTSPAPGCQSDPVIAEVGDEQNVRLYITYPAATRPTFSGRGDVAPGRWPVIVFAHANNDRQCEIYRRYYSLHDHWASWGFVVVSVDGTHTNCERGDKQNIEERVAGQLAAVDKLAELDLDPDSRFFGRVDLGTVVFAGHSRGGGASLVSAERFDGTDAVIDLQGIDLTRFGFGDDTLPDFPVLGMTAGEDVDLNYPVVELTEDQLGGPYTCVDINGGIHAWTADTVPIEPDDEPLIDQQQQHDITQYYTTAFLARWVGLGDGTAGADFEPSDASDAILHTHLGAETVDEAISEMGVYQRWRGPHEARWVDDFDDDNPDENLTGGHNSSAVLERSERVYTYRPGASRPSTAYRKSRSRLLQADAPGAFRMEVDGGLEAFDEGTLQARVKGPDEGAVADFAVVVELDDGASHRFEGHEHIGPEPLDNRFTQLVVPTDDFGGEKIAAVEFEVSDGALFVDDVRFVE